MRVVKSRRERPGGPIGRAWRARRPARGHARVVTPDSGRRIAPRSALGCLPARLRGGRRGARGALAALGRLLLEALLVGGELRTPLGGRGGRRSPWHVRALVWTHAASSLRLPGDG